MSTDDDEPARYNIASHLDSITPEYYRYALSRTPKVRLRRRQPVDQEREDIIEQASTASAVAASSSNDLRIASILLTDDPAGDITCVTSIKALASSQSLDVRSDPLQSISDNNLAGNDDEVHKAATNPSSSDHEPSTTLNRRTVHFAKSDSSLRRNSLDRELLDFLSNHDTNAQSDADDESSQPCSSRTSSTVQTVNSPQKPTTTRVTPQKRRRLPLGELTLVPNLPSYDNVSPPSSPRSSDDDSIEYTDAESHTLGSHVSKRRTGEMKKPLRPLSHIRKCIRFGNVAKGVSFDMTAYKLPKPTGAVLSYSHDGPFGGDGFRGQELALRTKRVNGRKCRGSSPVPGQCLSFSTEPSDGPSFDSSAVANTDEVGLFAHANTQHFLQDGRSEIASSEVSNWTDNFGNEMHEYCAMTNFGYTDDVSDDEQTNLHPPSQASLHDRQPHLRRTVTMDTQVRCQLSTIAAPIPESSEDDSQSEGSVHSSWESSVVELSRALYLDDHDDTDNISQAPDPHLRGLDLLIASPTTRHTPTAMTIASTTVPHSNRHASLDQANYYTLAPPHVFRPTLPPHNSTHQPSPTHIHIPIPNPTNPTLNPSAPIRHPQPHRTRAPNLTTQLRIASRTSRKAPCQKLKHAGWKRDASSREGEELDPPLPLEPPFRQGVWR